MGLLVGVGSLLWLRLLWQAPFHEDEAIYAVWARAILHADPWLTHTPIDKPPLTLYPIALSMALFGEFTWAARLPTLLWTLLALALLWRLAAQRHGEPWVAVALALCSPLLWAQAGAAFTDMAMIALALLALERAQRGRPMAAGAAFALAILAKPTALFLLPLLLACGGRKPVDWWGRAVAGWRPLLFAAALPLLAAAAWDASRTVPSWWVLGQQAYGSVGSGVAALGPWLKALLVTMGIPLGVALVGTSPPSAPPPPKSGEGGSRDTTPPPLSPYGERGCAEGAGVRASALLATLLLWGPVHLILGFQPWPRYLLPMVLLFALWASARRGVRRGMILALPLLLAMPLTLQPLALAPHDGRWEGIEEIAVAINALPAGTTLYYREMGRPLAWYARDARAELRWLGADGALPEGSAESYVVLRAAEGGPRGGRLVAEAGQFRLWGWDR